MTSATTEARWEHYEHEADIGVRGIGPTLASAFEQTAVALTAVVTDPEWVNDQQPLSIQCQATDPELLLVNWLNALIYEMSTRKILFRRFTVSIVDNHLDATAWGETVDRNRHQPAVEIKGATLTTLRVIKDKGQWLAQTVVDV
ncbi:MAG: archease [Proteobacteria bacterium]|nr:archease [Pseudomonadota bacterium]